jgi:excisionase family DNA binding protein
MKAPALNLTCPEIMTAYEVAEVLRIPVKTVRALIRDKKLKGTKTGRSYRVTRVDLERYLR